MKMLHIGLVLAVSCCFMYELSAKTYIRNNTAYEIKAIVEWAGSGRGMEPWAAFPGGIRKEHGKYILDNSVKGLMPGKQDSTSRDWSDIKNYWAVWVKKLDGTWSKDPDVTSTQPGYGGLLKSVVGKVTVGPNDENGNPTFDISVETGA